jgi:hypothetical protein
MKLSVTVPEDDAATKIYSTHEAVLLKTKTPRVDEDGLPE